MTNSCGSTVEAPVLVDFWLENFRLQVEARSGELRVELQGESGRCSQPPSTNAVHAGEPPRKRRRLSDNAVAGVEEPVSPPHADDFRMDVDQDAVLGHGAGDFGDYRECHRWLT